LSQNIVPCSGGTTAAPSGTSTGLSLGGSAPAAGTGFNFGATGSLAGSAGIGTTPGQYMARQVFNHAVMVSVKLTYIKHLNILSS